MSVAIDVNATIAKLRREVCALHAELILAAGIFALAGTARNPQAPHASAPVRG